MRTGNSSWFTNYLTLQFQFQSSPVTPESSHVNLWHWIQRFVRLIMVIACEDFNMLWIIIIFIQNRILGSFDLNLINFMRDWTLADLVLWSDRFTSRSLQSAWPSFGLVIGIYNWRSLADWIYLFNLEVRCVLSCLRACRIQYQYVWTPLLKSTRHYNTQAHNWRYLWLQDGMVVLTRRVGWLVQLLWYSIESTIKY